MPDDIQTQMTLYWVCDGNITEMEKFFDNKTEAELTLMSYLKLDYVKNTGGNQCPMV